MKKSWVFILQCLFISTTLNAQISYGVLIQNFGRNGSGGVMADSITAFTYSTIRLLESPPQGVGLFLEYRLKSRLPLILRGELNYRTGRSLNFDLLVVNNVTGKISPSSYSSLKPTYNFEIPLDLSYLILKRGMHVFKKVVDLEVGLLVGVSFQFQSRGDKVAYQSDNASGISDVNLAIYNSMKSLNYFYNYGLRVKFWNFILIYRYDQLLTNSATNDLNVWGNTYPYRTTYQYQSVSLGYTFSFKKKNRKD